MDAKSNSAKKPTRIGEFKFCYYWDIILFVKLLGARVGAVIDVLDPILGDREVRLRGDRVLVPH